MIYEIQAITGENRLMKPEPSSVPDCSDKFLCIARALALSHQFESLSNEERLDGRDMR